MDKAQKEYLDKILNVLKLFLNASGILEDGVFSELKHPVIKLKEFNNFHPDLQGMSEKELEEILEVLHGHLLMKMESTKTGEKSYTLAS